MKNYADRGGVLSAEAEADNTLRDLHNSSYHTKAEFNNCFIICSKYYQSFQRDKLHFIKLCNKFQSLQHTTFSL